MKVYPDDIDRWPRAGGALGTCRRRATLLPADRRQQRQPRPQPDAGRCWPSAPRRAARGRRDLRASGYTFLGHPDGRLVAEAGLRLDRARTIRRVRPDTADSRPALPARRTTSTTSTIAPPPRPRLRRSCRSPTLAWPRLELLDEGLEPHDVATVTAIPGTARRWEVPLEPADFDAKIAAMQAHVSQIGGWDAGGMIRQFAVATAEEAPQRYRAAGQRGVRADYLAPPRKPE
ncbi:MAG: hypothetical protein U0Z44_13775 [Kouleothrix sp.]